MKRERRKPTRQEWGQIISKRPVVVNERDDTILAGNHVYFGAMELGWDELAATFVDVDDDQAARIVLVDNRSADLSWMDNALVAELLDEVPSMQGTGYDDEAIEKLIAETSGSLENFEVKEKAQAEHQCPNCGHRFTQGG